MILRNLGRWHTLWSLLLLAFPVFLILSALLTLYISRQPGMCVISLLIGCELLGLPGFGVTGSDIALNLLLNHLESKNYRLEAWLVVKLIVIIAELIQL